MESLGHAIVSKCESISDVDRLLELRLEVVNLAPNNTVKSKTLSNLAGAYHSRYKITLAIEDLTKSLDTIREALKLLPTRDRTKGQLLANLGRCLEERFELRRDWSDLDSAIAAFNDAAEAEGTEESLKSFFHHEVSMALFVRYEVTGAEDDFNAAVKAGNDCLAMSNKGSVDYADAMANLASLHHERFDRTKDLADINRAIKLRKEALNHSAGSSFFQGQYLKELGQALRDRFEVTASRADMLEALERFSKCLDRTETPPTSRISAAVQAGRLANSSTSVRKGYEFFARATRLLSIASPKAASRSDQQLALSKCRSVGSDAAALCISCGEPYEAALKLLELGRGVMIHALLDVRSDVTELEKAHPDLAKRFKIARETCDAPPSPQRQMSIIKEVATRFNPYKELDQVISLIREKENFGNFLSGLSVAEMKSLASAGPIVYVNASEFGSDAFIVSQQSVQHCRLHGLKFEDLNNNERKFTEALKKDSMSRRRETNSTMKEVLGWLWDVVVDPILKLLGFSNTPQAEDIWPTVFWVIVGKLSLFPFHAAGYQDSPGQCTMDRVISSYAPTIRALKHAREKAEKIDSIQGRPEELMLAAMENTPKRKPLPYVALESDKVSHALPKSVKQTILKTPKKDELVSKIQQATMVHFACHGEVDPIEPFSSNFLLEDWEANPFSVADMTSLKLEQARFAYLSACHAASNGAHNLLDESIHMAGACLLAGFPTVIGTLWHVSDRYCASIAERVYRSMVTENGAIDYRKAASGLHFAVRDLRASGTPLIIWTPFVNFGV
ncbi:CHAT domain-containing protein [Hyaloscypha sp. PMI_1271]|nr:CHAT domain-containing protein [Hyaloscypha sp. PMI_1271]